MEMVYESSGDDSISLFNQVQIWLHTIICPDCAQQIERFEVSRSILSEDFFPSPPGLENSIMAAITAQEAAQEQEALEDYAKNNAVPGGLSTRGWVIAGLVILVSLATAFFGLDFQKMTDESGMSLMLPIGITFGIVLTSYGALFIGSHLKELSERFGL
jgi:hypothetical protein